MALHTQGTDGEGVRECVLSEVCTCDFSSRWKRDKISPNALHGKNSRYKIKTKLQLSNNMLLVTSCLHEDFLQLKIENSAFVWPNNVSRLFFFGKRRLWDSRVHLRCHSQIGRSIRRKKEETAEECRNKVLASKHWHGSLSVHLCWFALTSLLSRFITLSQLELVYKWKTKTKILLFSPSMWPILNMGTVVWRGKYYIQPMKREEKDTFVSSFEVTTFYLFKLLSKYLH